MNNQDEQEKEGLAPQKSDRSIDTNKLTDLYKDNDAAEPGVDAETTSNQNLH